MIETVEMLTLDALEHAPTIWVVLTAREHLTRAECRDHLRQLLKSARRRWPEVEWFVQVEFQRRGALHLNLLVKGVPVGDVDDLREVLVERWCSRVDAEPVGQWCEPIEDGGGVVLYLSKMLAHGLKAEQRPPIGWTGHRTSQTRGYLVRPAAVMRGEAQQSLRAKRRLWRAMIWAENVNGPGAPSADLVELLVERLEARDLEQEGTWELVHRPPSTIPLRCDPRGSERPSPGLREERPSFNQAKLATQRGVPGQPDRAPVDRGTDRRPDDADPARAGTASPGTGQTRAGHPSSEGPTPSGPSWLLRAGNPSPLQLSERAVSKLLAARDTIERGGP